MQIQVNTDNQIAGGADLARRVERVVGDTLRRFSDRVTRVIVHLTDENSRSKSGDDDKRCVMEARLAGLRPIAVSHQGVSIEQAIDGAAAKLEKALDRTLGQLDARRSGMS